MKRLLANFLIINIFFQAQVWPKDKNYTEDLYFHEDYLKEMDKSVQDWIKEGVKQEETKKILGGFEQIFSELENYHEKPEFKDPWLLKEQRVVDLESNKVIEMNDPKNRFFLPEYIIKFEDQVEIKIESKGELVFEFFKIQKKVQVTIAKHVFPQMDAVKIAVDKELIHVLRKNGQIYSISKAIAEKGSFNSPLPWTLTAKVKPSVMERIKADPESIRFEFMTTGSEPIGKVDGKLDIHKDAIAPKDIQKDKHLYKAGDLLIADTKNNHQLLGLYNREVGWTFLGQSAKSLASIMNVFVKNGVIETAKAQDVPGAKSQELSEAEKRLLKLYEKQVNVSNEFIDKFIVDAHNKLKLSANPPERDLFDYLSWRQGFEELAEKAKKNLSKGELDKESIREQWQENMKRPVTKVKKMNPMLKTGLWFLAGLTSFMMVDYATFATRIGEAPMWMAWTIAKIQYLIPQGIFDVFMESSYLFPMVASVFWLLMILPLVDLVAGLAGKAMNMPKYVAAALGGVRFRAYMMTPFVVMYAKFARQKNYNLALKHKLSPYQKVKKDSKLGKLLNLEKDIKLGTNSFLINESRKNDQKLLENQKKAIQHLSSKRERKEAISWLLASLVVSERKNIDPATLLFMFQNGLTSISKEEIQNEEFKKKWAKTARNLFYSLKELDTLSEKELSEIKMEEILEYQKIAEKISSAEVSRNVRSRLKDYWRNFKIKSYEFYIKDYNWQKLKYGMPNEKVGRLTFTAFKEDYRFSAALSAVAGARADMNDPLFLAADPVGPLSNTRPHIVDMAEQVFIYMVPLMASNFLVYQADVDEKMMRTHNIDSVYNPREDIIIDGKSKDASYFKSWGQFWSEAFDLERVGYGHVFMKEFTTRLVNMRASLLTGVPVMYLGGIGAISAAMTVFWITFMGKWFGGAPWTIAYKGTMNAEETYEIKNQDLLEAKRLISNGVKEKDFYKVERGYMLMQSLYQEFGLKMSKKQDKNLDAVYKELAQKLMLKDTSVLKELRGIVESTVSLQVQLIQAIENKDEVKKQELSSRLLKMYQEHDIPKKEVVTQDAVELLKYSLKNPPLPRKFNEKTSGSIMLITGGLTTFLFSYMFAHALDPEADALQRLLNGVVWGSTLYGLFLITQIYVIDPIGRNLKAKKEFFHYNKLNQFKVRACVNAFL